MARINGNANGNGTGKYPAQASLGEVSPSYNLNRENDELFDETESKRMGHTRNDQKDMSRMGKRQELIVSSHTHPYTFFFLHLESRYSLMSFSYKKLEKFPSALGPELRRCTTSNVGVSFDVNYTPPPRNAFFS